MNYSRHYELLIDRARNRRLEGYVEKHHIVPRCLGGSDLPENIVALTAEEHFVAHELLTKMHPGHRGLAFAVLRMATGISKQNKIVGWHKKNASLSQKGRGMPKEVCSKISATLKAKETRHWTGKTHTEEARLKMSLAKKGKKLTQTHIDNVKSKITGKKRSEEVKANMKLGQSQVWKTPKRKLAGKNAWEVRKSHALIAKSYQINF